MIWGFLAILYAATVVAITVTKPEKIWEMKKILFFRKVLGEKGTEVFFYLWSFAFLFLGIWLITRS